MAAARFSVSQEIRIAVRLAAMAAWLLVCVPFHYLWRIGLRWPGRGHSRPWPRRFLGGICWIAGVDITVVGASSRTGAFLLSNHVSWIDITALAGTSGTAFVAHDGLAGVPLLRWLCSLNDTIFIARHDRASVQHQIEQVREAVGNGALAIFPEGTTSDGTGLLPFKSSLLSALDPPPEGVVIQPVLLDYGREAASVAWTGDEPGLANFLRILARGRPVALTVHYLAPLAGEALANRKTIAAAARAEILQALSSSRT